MPVPANSISMVKTTMAQSAQMTASPKQKGQKRIKVVASSLSCANEHRENRAAGRRTPYGAENGSDIERDRLRTSLRKSPIRFDVARRLCGSIARLR